MAHLTSFDKWRTIHPKIIKWVLNKHTMMIIHSIPNLTVSAQMSQLHMATAFHFLISKRGGWDAAPFAPTFSFGSKENDSRKYISELLFEMDEMRVVTYLFFPLIGSSVHVYIITHFNVWYPGWWGWSQEREGVQAVGRWTQGKKESLPPVLQSAPVMVSWVLHVAWY